VPPRVSEAEEDEGLDGPRWRLMATRIVLHEPYRRKVEVFTL